jgi:predicted amidohydrolase
MRVGLVQLNVSDDPTINLPTTLELVREAVSKGAELVVTPEVTNIVSTSHAHQKTTLQLEQNDQTLAAMSLLAAELKTWLLIGSLALKIDNDSRFVNRSFLISPDGAIAASYDKMHMFDVSVSAEETYRESSGYRAGNKLCMVKTPLVNIGMTICYDLRFPYLHRDLAQMGAQILTVPSAFSPITGVAHWEILLRARAIETGCYVVAPAQTGSHDQTNGNTRQTYGHSLVVDPWGAVILDAGTDVGAFVVDLDLEKVASARTKLPSLTHDQTYQRPTT